MKVEESVPTMGGTNPQGKAPDPVGQSSDKTTGAGELVQVQKEPGAGQHHTCRGEQGSGKEGDNTKTKPAHSRTWSTTLHFDVCAKN